MATKPDFLKQPSANPPMAPVPHVESYAGYPDMAGLPTPAPYKSQDIPEGSSAATRLTDNKAPFKTK